MKGSTRMREVWAVCRAGAAVGALLLACSPARAFYWHGWPGSRVTPVPTLIPPPSQTTPGTPTPPPPEQVPPGGPPGGPPVGPPPVGPPNQTPEPATGLIALAGLGAVAVRKWWKR